MYVCHVHTWGLWSSVEGVEFPALELRLLAAVWELNHGPLQEQPVPLTTTHLSSTLPF